MPENRPREPANWSEYRRAFPSARRHEIIRIAAERSQERADKIARQFSDVTRFWTGFRVAANFQSIQVEGIGAETAKGYGAAVKLLLAFAAAETIASAHGRTIAALSYDDPVLAEEFRLAMHARSEDIDYDGLKKKLRRLSVENWLIRSFFRVLEGDSDEILVIAAVFRNMIAHGKFTAKFLHIRGADMEDLLNHVTDAVLIESEREFNRFYQAKLRKFAHIHCPPQDAA